jgi:hypothetical protein
MSLATTSHVHHSINIVAPLLCMCWTNDDIFFGFSNFPDILFRMVNEKLASQGIKEFSMLTLTCSAIGEQA